MATPSNKKTGVLLREINRDEWETVTIAEMGDFFKGGGFSMKDTCSIGVPCTMYGDLYVKYSTRFSNVDYHIPPNIAKYSVYVRNGDLLFTASGENAEEIGKCAGYFGRAPICIGGDIIVLRPYTNYDSKFLAYLFNSSSCIRQKAMLGQGDAVVHISVSNLGGVRLKIPNKVKEQRIIAHSLIRVDDHLLSLKRLIAKQEAIKKATLKLLLEPKDETPLVPIGEAFTISGGLSASRADLGKTGLCYLHYGDIHSATTTTIDIDADYSIIPKLNIPLSKVSSKSLLLDGDVVFVDASEDDEGTSRFIVVRNKNAISFVAGLHTIVAKQKTQIFEADFLAYVFSSRFVKNQFVHYAVGTKVSGVNKRSIQNIYIPCPPLEKQKQIGKQLAAIDFILQPLQDALKKTQQIKQGMMRHFFGA